MSSLRKENYSSQSEYTNEDRLHYLEKTLLMENNNVIAPHLDQLDKKSLNYKMAVLIYNKLLSKSGNFLFTSVNLYKYLKMEYEKTEEEWKEEFDGHLIETETLNTFIFYPSDYAAVIIMTLPESETETHNKMHLRAKANIKAYLMLHHEKISKNQSKKLIVISVIGAVYQEKNKDSPFCAICSENNLVIYKEDFENDLKDWWKGFFERLDKVAKNYSFLYDAAFIKKTASMLASYLGETNDKFPGIHSYDDERLDKITLSAGQTDILFISSEQRKIIEGT